MLPADDALHRAPSARVELKLVLCEELKLHRAAGLHHAPISRVFLAHILACKRT